MDDELALLYSVLDPVETHVDGFGAPLFDGGIGNAGGTCIVRLDQCGALGMSHVFKGLAEYGTVFAVVEQRSGLGFGGGGHNCFDDGGVHMNGAIEGRWRIFWTWRCGQCLGTEEENSRSA